MKVPSLILAVNSVSRAAPAWPHVLGPPDLTGLRNFAIQQEKETEPLITFLLPFFLYDQGDL